MSTHDQYMTRRQARDLARRLARLERKTRSTAAAHADLRHSALDHGARIPVKDDQGNTTAYVGSGPTGIEHVGGPVPAQPAPVFVDAGQRVIKVQHSGLDVDEDPAPADFKHAEVHVSQEQDFVPSLSTYAVNLDTANGSVTHSLPAGEWYVGVVWVTLSGQRSPMSEPVLAVIEPPVDAQDIQDTLDTAQEALDEYRDNVAAPRFQALETGLSENADNLADARTRLSAAESTLAPLPAQVAEAQLEAETAKSTADQAIEDILAVSGVADSKTQFFAQVSAPSGSLRKAGNLWMRLPDYKLHYFDSDADDWVVSTDADLIAAATDAANALSEADALKSRAAALELAVDGEGGLKDRLDSAEDDLENIDTELDQVATNLTTALTGPVDHTRLRAGEGAFDTGFIGELWAGNIRALAAELASLIVASPNMIPNGDLTQGDQFWRLGGAQIVTDDTPPGYAHAIRRAPNDGTMLHEQSFPVQGGQEYLFEMWIKADKPNSSFYWDMRDQDGTMVGAGGSRGSVALEPATGHNPGTRPVSDLTVPTEWSRVRTVLRPGDHVTELALTSLYFNHSLGSERDATVWIGGVRMTPRAGAEVLVDGSVTAEKIHATRELITKIMGAEWAYIAQQLIVDGKILTRDLEALSAAIQSLTVTQRADIAELWAEELWTALAVIEELQAEEAWITSAMISELTAEKVTVTQNFVGRVAELLHLVVDRIDANQLWADQTWQAAGHFGSDTADQSTLVDGTGLRITKHDQENESSTDVVRLGGEGIGLVFSDENGNVTGSLSHEGDASFRDMSADTITHGGRPLQDPDCQDYIHPSGNQSLITWRPRGMVAFGERELYGIDTPYRRFGFLEVAAQLYAGRAYKIRVTPFLMRNTSGNTTRLYVYHSDDGTPATFDDPELIVNRFASNAAGGNAVLHGEVLFTPQTTGTHRFLAAVYTPDGVLSFASPNSQNPVQLYVEDIGAAIPDDTLIRDTYGDHPDGLPDILGQVQTANSITTEWEATWFQNYSHDGTQKATNSTTGVGYAWNGLTQGLRPNAPSFGRYASLFGFNASTTSTEPADQGVTLAAALAGAEPLTAYLEVQNAVAYANTNATNYHFYWHNHHSLNSAPATWSSQDRIFEGSFSRFQVGQTRRVPVPLSLIETAGKTGELAGFGMPVGAPAAVWAGILSWEHKPKLVITYER